MNDLERGITIVMPTLGRVEIVQKALSSLRAACDLLPCDVGREFYMIDDSREPEASALRSMCIPERAEYYVRGPRIVGAKRNFGARLGKYKFILFLDSDCFPVPTMLIDHLAQLESGTTSEGRPIGAVTGAIVMESEASTWFWRVVDFTEIFNAPNLWPLTNSEVPWAPGGNFSMSREVFTEIGGFDEHPFTVVGGEDVDLCMRLRDSGYVISCVSKALVFHSRDSGAGFKVMSKKLFTYGRSSVYNAVRQPHHQNLHANRISLCATAITLTASAKGKRAKRKHAALSALGLTSGIFVLDVMRLMYLRKSWVLWNAAPAAGLEWLFDLGICCEAAARRRPRCFWTRFRYFDEDGFRSLSSR